VEFCGITQFPPINNNMTVAGNVEVRATVEILIVSIKILRGIGV
jgi:hypothetical protein